MTEPAIFFSDVNERQGVFHRRALVMGGLFGLGLAALGVRLAQLQVFENSRYTTLAAANQFNFRLITPPRGRIIDRDGVELASNRAVVRLLMVRDEKIDPDDAIDAAAQPIPNSDDHRRQILRD